MNPPNDATADLRVQERRNVRNQFLKLQKSLRKEEFQDSVPNVPNVPAEQPPEVTEVIAEQARSRAEAYTRRQTLRSLQREQINAARQAGLRARHAAREQL